MSNWRNKFGILTVSEALKMNEAAKKTCEWETTSQAKEEYGCN